MSSIQSTSRTFSRQEQNYIQQHKHFKNKIINQNIYQQNCFFQENIKYQQSYKENYFQNKTIKQDDKYIQKKKLSLKIQNNKQSLINKLHQKDNLDYQILNAPRIKKKTDKDPNIILQKLIRQRQKQGYKQKNQNRNINQNQLKNKSKQQLITRNTYIFINKQIQNSVKCKLKRASGLVGLFKPQYQLSVIHNNQQYTISAKKQMLNSKQVFSFEIGIDKNQYVGTLFTNKYHNSYWMFGQQQKINLKNLENQTKKIIKYKNVYVGIQYQKINKLQKYRKMKVILPSNKRQKIGVYSNQSQLNLSNLQLLSDIILQNKQYQNNKLNMISDKCFILVDKNNTQCQYLKMQKIANHQFTLDIKQPLTILQGFSIALTRFDVQLN